MNTLEIRPYEGVGPVSFAMNRIKVQQVLGPPQSVSKNFLEEDVEVRGDVMIHYDSSSRNVAEVTFGRQTSVSLNGKVIEPNLDCLSFLRSLDQEPEKRYGFLVFQKLGIAISGLATGDEDQYAVCVFCRGRWDGDFVEPE